MFQARASIVLFVAEGAAPSYRDQRSRCAQRHHRCPHSKHHQGKARHDKERAKSWSGGLVSTGASGLDFDRRRQPHATRSRGHDAGTPASEQRAFHRLLTRRRSPHFGHPGSRVGFHALDATMGWRVDCRGGTVPIPSAAAFDDCPRAATQRPGRHAGRGRLVRRRHPIGIPESASPTSSVRSGTVARRGALRPLRVGLVLLGCVAPRVVRESACQQAVSGWTILANTPYARPPRGRRTQSIACGVWLWK